MNLLNNINGPVDVRRLSRAQLPLLAEELRQFVGHQTYPHKILTGRRDQMKTLRQLNGISGFPRRDESVYDTFGTAHASTSISAALGMAKVN